MLKLKTKLGLGIATFSLLSSIGITPAIATTSTTVPVDATPSARLAGTNRVDTALKVATHAFKGQKPRVMYLASSDDRHLVDATTAGKLADGPVLYAPNSPDAAARLAAAIASNPIFSGVEQVTAIGGTASVHEATLDTVAKAVKASQTGRLAGADRYATAEDIATHILAQAKAGNPAYKNLFDKNGRLRAVYLANGGDAHLVDSMVAGTLGDGPTLLTRPDGTLSEVARQLLAQAKPVQVTGLGGARALPEATLQAAAAVGSANASRLGGANRFATAASIAKHYTQIHGTAGEVYVAGGAATADAIIAGQLKHGPILLVKPGGETPTETASVLRDFAKNSGKNLMIYGIGGQASLPEAQLRQATQPDGANGDGKAEEKPKAGASGSSGGSSSSGSSGSSGGGFGGGSSSSGSSGGGVGSGSNSSSDSGSSSTPKESEKSPAPSNPADKPQPPADKPGAQQSDQPGDKPEKPDTEKPRKSEGQPGDQPKPGAQQPGKSENKPGGQVPGTDELNPKQPESQPQKPGANTPQPKAGTSGSSDGSSSSGSSSSSEANSGAHSQPSPQIQPKFDNGKNTLNSTKNETTTVRFEGAGSEAVKCDDLRNLSQGSADSTSLTLPQIEPAASTVTIKTTPATSVGRYTMWCSVGGQSIEVKFIVQKQHSAPSTLTTSGSTPVTISLSSSASSGGDYLEHKVAMFSKNDGGWNNLKKELGNKNPGVENYEVEILGLGSFDASGITGSVDIDSSSIVVKVPKNTGTNKSFTVRLRAKESDRYLPSEWTNAITVTITK